MNYISKYIWLKLCNPWHVFFHDIRMQFLVTISNNKFVNSVTLNFGKMVEDLFWNLWIQHYWLKINFRDCIPFEYCTCILHMEIEKWFCFNAVTLFFLQILELSLKQTSVLIVVQLHHQSSSCCVFSLLWIMSSIMSKCLQRNSSISFSNKLTLIQHRTIYSESVSQFICCLDSANELLIYHY